MKKSIIAKVSYIMIGFVVLMTSIFVYSLKNNKTSLFDENEILLAAIEYIEDNEITVDKEINLPISLLKKEEYLQDNVAYTDDSYITVKNDNGKYTYESNLERENLAVQVLNNMVDNNTAVVYGAIGGSATLGVGEPIYEPNQSIRTKEVNVTIPVSNLRFLELPIGWEINSNNDGIIRTNPYYENISETVQLNSTSSYIANATVLIDINNIDTEKPTINGVTDGTIYTEDVTIEYSKKFNGVDVPLTVELYKDGTLIDFRNTISDDGNYRLIVKDDFENKNEINFTIDQTAPRVDGVENNGYYNDDKRTIEFYEGTANIEYTVNGETTTTNNIDRVYDVTSEGKYVLTVTDDNGNSNVIHFTIDRTAPTISKIEYDGCDKEICNSNGFKINNDIVVKITYDEPISLIAGQENGWTISSDNNKQIYQSFEVEDGNEVIQNVNAIVADLATNPSEVYNVNFIIDKKAPTGTITSNPDSTILTNESVTLTLETDEDVVITNQASYNVQQVYENNKRVYSVVRNEPGIFTFKFKDLAGNVGTAEYNVTNIDKEGPKFVGITYNGIETENKNFKDNVTVVITYDEILGQAPEGWTISDKTITKTFELDNNQEEIITENVIVKDFIGNASEEYELNFTIDKKAPTGTVVEQPSTTIPGAVDLILTTDEAVIITNNASSNVQQIDEKTAKVTRTQNGKFTFKFKDKADNEGRVSYTVTTVDEEGPKLVSITYNGVETDNKNFKDNVTVVITYDEFLGQAPEGWTISDKIITKTFEVNNKKEETINENIVVKDSIGNSSEEYELNFTIDKKAPTGTVVEQPSTTIPGAVDLILTTDEAVIITNNASSNVQQIDERTAKVTRTQNGSFTFKFEDLVGNTGRISYVVTTVDEEGPKFVSITYNGVETDNKNFKDNVTVVIAYDEVLGQAPKGWTISDKTITKTFEVNNKKEETINENIVVKDSIGNSSEEYELNFTIDKKAPTGTVVEQPSTTIPGAVDLILTTDEDVVITNNASSNVQQIDERTAKVTRTQNGSFTFKFKDLAENTGRVTYIVENIDEEGPKFVSITYNGVETENKNFKDNVTVVITYDEVLGQAPEGWTILDKVITKTFELDNNQEEIITENIIVKDLLGNSSEEYALNFTIDKKAPIIFYIEEGKIYNTPIIVDFSDGTATLNGQPFDKGGIANNEGINILTVTDLALNSTTVTFIIDTQKPNIVGVENNGYYNVNKQITITDVTQITATLNGTTYVSSEINAEGNNILVLNAIVDGTYKLTVSDQAEHSDTITFTIDKIPPKLVVYEKTDVIDIEHFNNFQITQEYSNTETFDKFYAKVIEDIDPNIEVVSEGQIKLNQLGVQSITYTATDKANNSASIVASVNVIDSQLPTVDYVIENSSLDNGWYNEPIIVKVTGTDIGTGISKYEYRLIDNGVIQEWQVVGEDSKFVIDVNSSNISFDLRSYDGADNISIIKHSDSYKIDTQKPEMIYSLQNTPNSNGWYNEDLSFIINVSDNLSGVASLKYSYSIDGGNVWNEWTNLNVTSLTSNLVISAISENLKVKFELKDNAENTLEYSINDVYKVNKRGPVITVVDGENIYTSNFEKTVKAIKNGTYNLPTATAVDSFNNKVNVTVSGNVDIETVGIYNITYSATDEAGNLSEVIMTVNVKDTETPIITLLGDNPLTIEYGHPYVEYGAEVTDDIDIGLTVNIDSSAVNTNRIGEYDVIYSATDSSNNTSTVTRKVKVVATTTQSLVRNSNNCLANKDCYVTNGDNNYVWYSGYLWRIIKVNEDNTVKLITEDAISGFSYDDDSSVFGDSLVGNWLNSQFYNSLNNRENIVTTGKYCIDKLMPTIEYKDESGSNTFTEQYAKANVRYNCNDMYKAKVGLLTIDEYNIIGSEASYLNNKDHFFTMTPSTDKTAWVVQTDGLEKAWNLVSNTYAIRPVITIKSDIEIIEGSGTAKDPYRISKDNSGISGELLNSRYAGEYVKFGDQLWRIVKPSGTYTKVIMDSYYQEANEYGNRSYAKLEYGGTGVYSGSNVENYLKNTVYNDLFTDREKAVLVETKWYYNVYAAGYDPLLLTLVNPTQHVKSNIGLINIGEIMSGTSATGRVNGFSSWTMNYVNDPKGEKYAWYISWGGTSGYIFDRTHIRGIRPAITLNPNLTITSGTGTANDPYILNY